MLIDSNPAPPRKADGLPPDAVRTRMSGIAYWIGTLILASLLLATAAGSVGLAVKAVRWALAQ